LSILRGIRDIDWFLDRIRNISNRNIRGITGGLTPSDLLSETKVLTVNKPSTENIGFLPYKWVVYVIRNFSGSTTATAYYYLKVYFHDGSSMSIGDSSNPRSISIGGNPTYYADDVVNPQIDPWNTETYDLKLIDYFEIYLWLSNDIDSDTIQVGSHAYCWVI